MNGRVCDDCGSTDRSVVVYELFGEGEPGGELELCWDCRWPYIRKRVFGPDATGPPGGVEVPSEPSEETEHSDPMAW